MEMNMSRFPDDLLPGALSFYDDIVAGLQTMPKKIASKYFYDEHGSKLFNAICELEEYYPTRTEIEITKRNAADIGNKIGEDARLVELGAGDGIKTRHLVNHMGNLGVYMPVDISPTALERCTRRFSDEFPHIAVRSICADYTGNWTLPAIDASGPTVFYYPGSTLGNFSREAARRFLADLGARAGQGGGLLIGIDLHKDRAILEAAYNDARGVTAAFNLNLLRRINDACKADFDLNRFRHLAIYDEDRQRIEMRLISTSNQVVKLGEHSFYFEEGEYIVTEHSHKYTIENFSGLAESAGWAVRAFWTDEGQLFSIWYLEKT